MEMKTEIRLANTDEKLPVGKYKIKIVRIEITHARYIFYVRIINDTDTE